MPSSDTQFKVGGPGGPGRPKGSRSQLSQSFIKALADDFELHGAETISQVRLEDPDKYLGTIGKLMPKLMELSGKDGAPIETVSSWKVQPVKTLDAEDDKG